MDEKENDVTNTNVSTNVAILLQCFVLFGLRLSREQVLHDSFFRIKSHFCRL